MSSDGCTLSVRISLAQPTMADATLEPGPIGSGPIGRRAAAAKRTDYLRGLRGMLRVGRRSVIVHRFDLIVGLFTMVIQVILTTVVWRVVYGTHGQVAGIAQQTAVAYAVLAACFQTIVTPWQFSSIPMRLRLGQIGVDLIRPHGLIAQTLAQSVGTITARIPIGLVGLLVGLALGALRPPHSVGLGLMWAVSMVLGIANVQLANVAMSMLAFWTTDVSGPFIVYRFISTFAAGGLIPIWFMPVWLQDFVGLLPFQAQMFTPLTIWFGTISGGRVVVDLAIQVGWVLALAVIARVLWARAIRRVVVQGG